MIHIPFHHHHQAFSHDEWVGVRIVLYSLLGLGVLGYLIVATARGDFG